MLILDKHYNHCNLLAIDPGLNNIGLCAYELYLNPFKLNRIHATTIKEDRVIDDVTYDSETALERDYKRARMVNAVMRHVLAVNPAIVVCESPFFDRSKPGSFAILTEVILEIRQGVYRFNDRIRFSFLAPQAVKKTLGVAGIKGKDIVREAMEKQTHLLNVLDQEIDDIDDHSIDAMAVGYTFMLQNFETGETLCPIM